ncbi:MAG: hypothetical protein KGJ44_08850 [Betaproteobacteria bacterium]|nr:hypothetical protein [Betaproteobacteria bacterium]
MTPHPPLHAPRAHALVLRAASLLSRAWLLHSASLLRCASLLRLELLPRWASLLCPALLLRSASLRHWAWLLAGAAALALPAHAELVPLKWNAQGQHVQRLRVPPGKFAELCGPLAQGARVSWHFRADAPLDFNIHYHAGEQVVTPDEARASAERRGRLTVPATQDYCWMWTNRAAQVVTLHVDLRRE